MSDKPRYQYIYEILSKMNEEGNFSASVLATGRGLEVSSAVHNQSASNAVAAMISYIHHAVIKVKEELQLGKLKYVVLKTSDGALILTSLGISNDFEEDMILGVLIPKGVRYFSRTIAKAVRNLRAALLSE